jgi:hypothetical protein
MNADKHGWGKEAEKEFSGILSIRVHPWFLFESTTS